MATHTSPRSASAASRQSKRKPSAAVEETQPIWSKLRSAGRGLSSFAPSIDIPRHLRREATGVVLALAAALTSWTLWSGKTDGRLTDLWQDAVGFCLGRGAFVAPILFVLIAYRTFAAGEGKVLFARHIAGGIMFTLASSGLIALAGRLDKNRPGGWIGHFTGDWTSSLIGSVGGGVFLFVAGGVGVFLMTGTDIRMLVSDIRTLIPARTPKPEADELAAIEFAPVARPARPQATERPATASPAPVINRRHMEPTPKAAARPAVKAAPVTAGEPMPLPDVSKLALYDGVKLDEADLTTKARRIEETLASFKVEARCAKSIPARP